MPVWHSRQCSLQAARRRAVGTLIGLFLLLLGAGASAAPTVTLRLVASGLARPLELVNAGDSSARLFIVEQTGKIKILKNGSVLATPFLDLSALVATAGEQGLLGLAFPPNYLASGAFYVYYARLSDGAIQVARYLRDASDPNLADPASGVVLMTIPHPGATNHYGGRMAFGPDGHLYIGVGDGGVGNGVNAQNRAVLLGKLLRIAVDGGTAYAIPAGNPFSGASCNNGADPGTGTCPEIWAYGLRNPWKFSFDRLTGDLLIADVGQASQEEVNFQPAGAAGGRNYGWNQFEGNDCYLSANPACTPLAGHVPPVITYSHVSSNNSITGGYRYRGSKSLAMRGYYFFGDFVSRRIWVAQPDGGGIWQVELLFDTGGVIDFGISSFGEDEAGELYVVRLNNTDGRIYALEGTAPGLARGDFDGTGKSDIFWLHAVSPQTLIGRMDGKTVAGTGTPAVTGDSNWQMQGSGDFNGDGKADVLWRHAVSGATYIWFMNDTSLASTGSPPQVSDSGWQIQGVGDFNGDGKADVLWKYSATGQTYVWLMNGAMVVGTGTPASVGGPGGWEVKGIGDFNGDGKADVFWRHAGSGTTYVWLMNGTAIADKGSPTQVSDFGWQVQGVGDFNGDGKADVLWKHTTTGQTNVWLMNGLSISSTGTPASVGGGSPGWEVKGIGDYNGDGKADVFWRHSGTGATHVWLMNGLTIADRGSPNTVSDFNWQVQNSR